jgi:hypothetical protein
LKQDQEDVLIYNEDFDSFAEDVHFVNDIGDDLSYICFNMGGQSLVIPSESLTDFRGAKRWPENVHGVFVRDETNPHMFYYTDDDEWMSWNKLTGERIHYT